MKRRFVVVLFCVLALTPALIAQQPNDPATKEDVQTILDVTASRKMFDTMMDAMKQQIPAMMESTLKQQVPDATPEQRQAMMKFANSQMEKMFATMPFDEMMQSCVPVYQRHFTHGEMQELIGFYNSPLGKKVIAEMPALMSESMQAMMPVIQKWSQAGTAEMMKSAEDFAKEMKQKKSATPKKASNR